MPVISTRPFLHRWGVLLAAMALTAVMQFVITCRSPLIAWDGIRFIEIAQRLGTEPLAVMQEQDQHPGYPALVWLCRRMLVSVNGDLEFSWHFAARTVASAFGVAGVPLLWFLARRLASETVANISVLLFATLPVLRQNAADALSDTPHLTFYIAGAWLICEALARRSLWLFLLAGLCSGAAFLIRPEGLSVFIVGFSLAVMAPKWCRGIERARSAVALALAGGALLLVVPYVVSSGKLTSKITSKPGWQALRGNGPAAPSDAKLSGSNLEAVDDGLAAAPAGPGTSAQVASVLNKIGRGLVAFGRRLTESWRVVLLVPLLVGIPALTRQAPSAPWRFMCSLALFHFGLLMVLFYLGDYMDRRHLMPLTAILIPTVAAGITKIVAVAGPARLYASAGISILLLGLLVPRCLRPLHPSQIHKYEAAQLLQRFATAEDQTTSNSVHVLYYAGQLGRLDAESGLLRRSGAGCEELEQQVSRRRFAAIEMGGEHFHASWPNQLDANYRRLVTIRGDAALQQNDIVIFGADLPEAAIRTAQQIGDRSWAIH